MNDKKNAFDLLRILLATCVLINHGLLNGGYRLQDPLAHFSKNQTDLAEIGVMGFFSLSGFLIAASYERTENVFLFISHRALRILPGFWMCLMICAFVFAPAIFWLAGSSFRDFSFIGNDSSLEYIGHNFFFKIYQWSFIDVLNHSAYQGSLNGSLWSLFPEIQCYGITILVGMGSVFRRNKLLYLLIAIVLFAFFAIDLNFSSNLGPTIFTLSPAMKLYAAYIAGTLVYVFRDELIFDLRGTVLLCAFTLLLLKFGGFKLISPLLIAMTLINLFQLFEYKIRYDISYGVYIYGFIIEQFLYILLGNRLHPVLFILVALLTSALLGLLSFLLVERPFMNLRKKLDMILMRLLH